MLAAFALVTAGSAQAADPAQWEGYLDYAYVYSSADAASLSARLSQYGRDAGLSLEDYVVETFEQPVDEKDIDEQGRRRQAIAYLLQYLVSRDPDLLEKSFEVIEAFEGQTGRHENAYWYHYILAQRALERGNAPDFVRHNLGLWLDVVVPLESAYETLESLSLSQSANSGFVSALPYVFENQARLILLRSQEMGMNRDLDALAAVVRMLADGRVGAHPDIIPPEVSSRPYVERILARMNGPESDGGSLTFTLALFDAGRYHEQARGLLAAEGLSDETVKAIGIASGAYETALDRAHTAQGQAAVYIRVLRQIGEVYAAKQRLGVDPYVETSFSIEGAIDVYATLFDAHANDEWKSMGFRHHGWEAYVKTLHSLWEEIQETHLNAADYYLSRSVREKSETDDMVRSAARMYSRYISFFNQFATRDAREFVPDSAYFAAYECGKGFGDAYMSYSVGNLTPTEVDMVSQRYVHALRTYPFDRRLWASLTTALERKGQSNDYMSIARPIADDVVRSRDLHKWIQEKEIGFEPLGAMRRALADDLVLMYLGFADADGPGEIVSSVAELRARRGALRNEIAGLEKKRDQLAGRKDGPPAAPAPTARSATRAERSDVVRDLNRAVGLLGKIERQIKARERAVPLYQAAGDSDALIDRLRVQRDHLVHSLLRRLYHENGRGEAATDEEEEGEDW